MFIVEAKIVLYSKEVNYNSRWTTQFLRTYGFLNIYIKNFNKRAKKGGLMIASGELKLTRPPKVKVWVTQYVV